MISKIIISVITILFLILSSCDENPIENNSNSFELIINVTRNSTPLSNADISIWSKIISESLPKRNYLTVTQAVTSIQFSLKQEYFVTLELYDLDNNLIESIIPMEKLSNGLYSNLFYNDFAIGSYVLNCTLECYDDSLSPIPVFSDSIYITLINPDPSLSIAGRTNSEGKVQLTDINIFPGLFNLPKMPRTSEVGPTPLDYFSFTNSIIIYCQGRYFEEEIMDGKNVLNLDWEDGATENPDWFLDNSNKGFYKIKNDKNVEGVVYSYFIGEYADGVNTLKWGTTSEIDNYGFEVQRKIDEWIPVGFVDGHGTANETNHYIFIDKIQFQDDYYYRLKQIDINGNSSYSDSISITNVEFENKLYQNFPNPYN